MSQRFLITIPAAAKDQCNALALASFDPIGGGQTFTVPLFNKDTKEDSSPTNYWCSAVIENDLIPLLQQLQIQISGSTVDQYDDPNFPQQKLQTLNLRTSFATLQT